MPAQSPLGKVLKVFYSYAHTDSRLRKSLEKHLSSLQRQGLIKGWHDGEIGAGSVRDEQLRKYLSQSDIILLLISPDFVASDYCYGIEMNQALERHKRGEAHVIPILLRPTAIQGLPFASLTYLPLDGKPVTAQKNRDTAFLKIVESIRNLIVKISDRPLSEPVPFAEAGVTPSWWKVPYAQNPFFSGRVSLLERLHERFRAKKAGVVIQILKGLGGIGKTQTALEYVYRYAEMYQAIFWVTADPQGDLLADFVSIAHFLDLPEKQESNQAQVVAAIKQWLQRHRQWLLVCDNVEDVSTIKAFLPASGDGHVLITTRAQATGNIAATTYEIEPMDLQEGTHFLLQRVKLLTQDMTLEQVGEREKEAAQEIVRLFAGHPLALDQAGAYLEETGLSLSNYPDLYQQRQAALLNYRGEISSEHADSVMATFLLAFERLEQAHPAAAELLSFCAFLHPDALPEELLMEGAASFNPASQALASDPYALDTALAALRKYSLLRRNSATKTVNVHRLVQDVIRSGMSEEQQLHWAELAVRTLSREFPDGEPASWPFCIRYLPHARVCLQWIERWQMRFVEAAHLLHRVGYYLYQRAEYVEAQLRYEQALELLKEEEEPLLAAHILSRLGVLHLMLSHYPEAEQCLDRAWRLREHLLAPPHPDLAQNLNDLAGVYHHQGRSVEAESLYQQALLMQEQTLDAEDPVMARTLNNLALLKYNQKNYPEAELLNQRALAAREKSQGARHVDTGQSLLNLAYVYLRQQKYAEAEPLFKRALAIYEETYGPEHPQTAVALNGLAQLYQERQRYHEAEILFRRVLAIWAETIGTKHPRNSGVLKALAIIALHQEKPEEADRWLRQALEIQEKTSWLEESDLVPTFQELARIYERQRKYSQAASLRQFMERMRLGSFEEEHSDETAPQED